MNDLISLACIFFVSFAAHALVETDVCGKYDFVRLDNTYYATLTSYNGVRYRVRNPNGPEAKNMVSTLCYCVRGFTDADPRNPGDVTFGRILIAERPIIDNQNCPL